MERGSRTKQGKALPELSRDPTGAGLPGQQELESRDRKRENTPSFSETPNTFCDLLTSPAAPLGVADFQFSLCYFSQSKELLLLFALAAIKSLVEKEVGGTWPRVRGARGRSQAGEEPSSSSSLGAGAAGPAVPPAWFCPLA